MRRNGALANQHLLVILGRRFSTWPRADREWLLERLAADHRDALAAEQAARSAS